MAQNLQGCPWKRKKPTRTFEMYLGLIGGTSYVGTRVLNLDVT